LVIEIKAASKVGRGNYGSPRVHRELRANGRRIGRKRVERLMRQEGIVARKKRRFRKTTDSNHKHPIAPNVLARNFDVELPNTAWVTDVTYVWTHEGWLYLACDSRSVLAARNCLGGEREQRPSTCAQCS
jgi:transposase InsO family protein